MSNFKYNFHIGTTHNISVTKDDSELSDEEVQKLKKIEEEINSFLKNIFNTGRNLDELVREIIGEVFRDFSISKEVFKEDFPTEIEKFITDEEVLKILVKKILGSHESIIFKNGNLQISESWLESWKPKEIQFSSRDFNKSNQNIISLKNYPVHFSNDPAIKIENGNILLVRSELQMENSLSKLKTKSLSEYIVLEFSDETIKINLRKENLLSALKSEIESIKKRMEELKSEIVESADLKDIANEIRNLSEKVGNCSTSPQNPEVGNSIPYYQEALNSSKVEELLVIDSKVELSHVPRGDILEVEIKDPERPNHWIPYNVKYFKPFAPFNKEQNRVFFFDGDELNQIIISVKYII
jgi:gas vesicle protein